MTHGNYELLCYTRRLFIARAPETASIKKRITSAVFIEGEGRGLFRTRKTLKKLFTLFQLFRYFLFQ